ncbi:hypothetical protein BDR26DRAFT_980629 [Obelidium mucronatum]|nr:hypothetical protein BDR26DRAFT_980629 [Obelidium mucronatum]
MKKKRERNGCNTTYLSLIGTALAAAAAAARLNDEQAQELCRHVKLLGLTAKLAHMGHINYFATLYDRPPEVIQAFIRVAIKDQAPVSGEIRVNDLNTSGSGVTESVSTSGSSSTSTHVTNQSLQPGPPPSNDLETIRTSLSELQSQVNLLRGSSSPSLDERRHFSSSELREAPVVLKQTVFARKPPSASVYSRYQLWSKNKMKAFNCQGLASDSTFKPLNFTQWEAKQRSATGQTLYHQILEGKTDEHKTLCADWMDEVENAKKHEEPMVLSANIAARMRNREIEVFKRVSQSLATKGVELQGCLFNVENGATEDVSTGRTGKRVSKKLYNIPAARPPSLFRMVLFKKDPDHAKRLVLTHAEKHSLEGMRSQVRRLLLQKQNAALQEFKLNRSNKFQISKLLSENGFKGIVMDGYPFQNAKSYSRLTMAQCQEVLSKINNLRFRQVALVDSNSDDDQDDIENSSDHSIEPGTDDRIRDLEDSDTEDQTIGSQESHDEGNGSFSACDQFDTSFTDSTLALTTFENQLDFNLSSSMPRCWNPLVLDTSYAIGEGADIELVAAESLQLLMEAGETENFRPPGPFNYISLRLQFLSSYHFRAFPLLTAYSIDEQRFGTAFNNTMQNPNNGFPLKYPVCFITTSGLHESIAMVKNQTNLSGILDQHERDYCKERGDANSPHAPCSKY